MKLSFEHVGELFAPTESCVCATDKGERIKEIVGEKHGEEFIKRMVRLNKFSQQYDVGGWKTDKFGKYTIRGKFSEERPKKVEFPNLSISISQIPSFHPGKHCLGHHISMSLTSNSLIKNA